MWWLLWRRWLRMPPAPPKWRGAEKTASDENISKQNQNGNLSSLNTFLLFSHRIPKPTHALSVCLSICRFFYLSLVIRLYIYQEVFKPCRSFYLSVSTHIPSVCLLTVHGCLFLCLFLIIFFFLSVP